MILLGAGHRVKPLYYAGSLRYAPDMLDYAKSLNAAQYAAATCDEDSVLVVAGAGSGKTRTITYRLAWLVDQGVAPESILLLTFTRKAAGEMLGRASALLDQNLGGVAGGTFHAFAFNALRRCPPAWLGNRPFTLMDASDAAQAVRQCRETLGFGKKDTSFPKAQTIVDILSKSRNKELDVPTILQRDSFHLLPHAEAIIQIGEAYQSWRRQKGLLDYDDLLFELEALLQSGERRVQGLLLAHSHILVDEYQDTNLVQARLVRLLATCGSPPAPVKVMAVGDEAQSIYAFRGANVRNILDFPRMFPNTRIITLEENYRSTQPILDVANNILDRAPESFHKNLFTKKKGGQKAKVVVPLSDTTQAGLVCARIGELLSTHMPHEIAVLFRSGYHSYPLENALRKAGIAFRKYGGLKFTEAAHVKDLLAFGRLCLNPFDLPAFGRVAAMHKGIGPRTITRLHNLLIKNDREALKKALARFPGFAEDLGWIDEMRVRNFDPYEFFTRLLEYYRPRLESLYPEDWPMRMPGLDEIVQIAAGYDSLELFMADLALENPDNANHEDLEDCVTLSTIHSAKGLEWRAVLIIDVVEERFPSRHALARPEDFEEERRLFYVACTRAKETLELYAPATVFNRADQGNVPAVESPFLRELDADRVDRHKEKFDGLLAAAPVVKAQPMATIRAGAGTRGGASPVSAAQGAKGTGYCRHRIFGRGKIVRRIDDEKIQVNFPGFGLKVILADYLVLED